MDVCPPFQNPGYATGFCTKAPSPNGNESPRVRLTRESFCTDTFKLEKCNKKAISINKKCLKTLTKIKTPKILY